MIKATTAQLENACFRMLAWYFEKGSWPSVHVPKDGDMYTPEEMKDAIKRTKAYFDSTGKMPTSIRVGEEVVVPIPTPSSPQTEIIYLRKSSVSIPQVYMFQEVIQKKGYYQGFILDGIFGDETEKAVKQIQKANNIEQTGGIGCLTWNAGVYPPCPFSGPITTQSEYLQATNNCEVNDSLIQQKARELKTPQRIFEWVRDALNYGFYYNTKYGAVGTIKNGGGNCCDLAHVVIAISRAAGIPARYAHSTAIQFSSGVYGHVWAELYINGIWTRVDASNNGNELGVNPADNQILKARVTYKELPF